MSTWLASGLGLRAFGDLGSIRVPLKGSIRVPLKGSIRVPLKGSIGFIRVLGFGLRVEGFWGTGCSFWLSGGLRF